MLQSIKHHLRDRHVHPAHYHLTVDEEDRVATFLLFNLSGSICGYQQYRPDADKKARNHPREGRYYTYRSSGKLAVFGLETFHRNGPLFMTEGVFDAVRLHNLGLAAIATLSNDPKHLGGWLRSLSRFKVAVCDPGSSGKFLANYADEIIICPGNEDLGAMKQADVDDLLRGFCPL